MVLKIILKILVLMVFCTPSEFVLPKSYAAQYATDFNQIQRFEKDNEDYIKTLKRQPGLDDANFRSDLGSVTQEQKNKFNELAKSVNQDSYDNLKLKGFTLPVYDSNGSVKAYIYMMHLNLVKVQVELMLLIEIHMIQKEFQEF
ncbi:hypothetical protein [Mycoplasmopsis cynos]|uniref:hypothetical protein n=1 Tax=Mycoplasmopsis cynos TaxID=171284 RepID=UPI00220E5B31|nr:hypothetical protein [Mycoplasmopsis cynos]UWV77663.1 hypothetical protein NW070_01935 [Mycoplasmopsis cynos]